MLTCNWIWGADLPTDKAAILLRTHMSDYVYTINNGPHQETTQLTLDGGAIWSGIDPIYAGHLSGDKTTLTFTEDDADDFHDMYQNLSIIPMANQDVPGDVRMVHIKVKQIPQDGGGTYETPGCEVPVRSENDSSILAMSPMSPIEIDDNAAGRIFLGISDPDYEAHTVTLTISNGVDWGDFSGIHSSWTRTVEGCNIKYTQNFSAAANNGNAIQTALQNIRFVPRENIAPPGTSIDIPSYFSVTDAGGPRTMAFNFRVKSVNDAPLIDQVTGAQTIADNSSLQLFTHATLTDPDVGQTETLTITLSDKTAGDLSSALGGSYDAASGKYTYQGTAADAQALLRSLTFTPAGGLACGATKTVTCTLHAEDGGGGTAEQAISIRIQSHLAAPVVDPPLNPSDPIVVTPVILDYSASLENHSLMLPEGGSAQNIVGGSGDDILIGNSQNNQLNGGGGANQLWGAGGDDELFGGSGSTAFWFGRGDGHDRVTQAAGNSHDALYLYNVEWTNYTAGRQGNDLYFSLGDGSTLNLAGWYTMDVRERIQGFIFQNGIAAAWNDGAGAEVNLYDPCYAMNNIHMLQSFDSGPCTLRGGSGDDAIVGGAGNDNLWGNAGNDILAGGAGLDTYWFGRGDGQDMIASDNRNSEDIVNIYNTNDPSSITTSFSGNDLILQMGNGETLTLKDWKLGGGYQLNQFQAGGSLWHLSDDGSSWVKE